MHQQCHSLRNTAQHLLQMEKPKDQQQYLMQQTAAAYQGQGAPLPEGCITASHLFHLFCESHDKFLPKYAHIFTKIHLRKSRRC
jgi:hypothetical protein